ncbi:MAG: hypothetical protein ACOYZ6_05825 [Chloroflexota bacterium]
MTNQESTESASLNSPKPRSKALLAWMIVSQILGILTILAAAAIGVFGYLLDGKVSFGMFAIFLSPLLMLIPLAASWFAYAKRKEKQAWILTSLPIVYVCLDVGIMAAGITLGL